MNPVGPFRLDEIKLLRALAIVVNARAFITCEEAITGLLSRGSQVRETM